MILDNCISFMLIISYLCGILLKRLFKLPIVGTIFLCYLTVLLFANVGAGYRSINVYGALGKLYWHEVTEVLGGSPDQVPVCPPQILHRLAWDRIWASAMRYRRLTAWTVARRGCWPSFKSASSALMYVHADEVSCSFNGLWCLTCSNWKVTSETGDP